MRRKRRYLAFEVIGGLPEAHRSAVALAKGLGVDRSEIRIIEVDEDSGKGLLRCSLDLVDGVKRAIVGEGLPLRIYGVSGTIRAARRKYLPARRKTKPPGEY